MAAKKNTKKQTRTVGPRVPDDTFLSNYKRALAAGTGAGDFAKSIGMSGAGTAARLKKYEQILGKKIARLPHSKKKPSIDKAGIAKLLGL